MTAEMTRQGDVLLVRVSQVETKGLEPIAREGGDVVLAHGEATGHKHRFRGNGTRMFAPWPEKTEPSARIEHARKLLAELPEIHFPADAALIGVVELDQADALVHEEHSAIDHAEGCCIARRQVAYTPAAIQIVED